MGQAGRLQPRCRARVGQLVRAPRGSLECFRGGRGEEESGCEMFAILDTLILHVEMASASFIAQ